MSFAQEAERVEKRISDLERESHRHRDRHDSLTRRLDAMAETLADGPEETIDIHADFIPGCDVHIRPTKMLRSQILRLMRIEKAAMTVSAHDLTGVYDTRAIKSMDALREALK